MNETLKGVFCLLIGVLALKPVERPATGDMRTELLANSTFTFTGITFARSQPDLRRQEDPAFWDFSRC